MYDFKNNAPNFSQSVSFGKGKSSGNWELNIDIKEKKKKMYKKFDII